MSVSIWAFDDGYGDNKLYNGKDEMIIPSYCTHWKPRMKNELDKSKLDPYSHFGVEVDGEKFLIGQGALEQSSSLNWTGGINKHEDLNFPIIAKGCLAALAGRTKETVVEPLVMGLPVKAEESEERVELLQNLMLGQHEVKITLANGNSMEKIITVNEVITKKQPFGSFCYIILDDNGNVKNKEMASQFNVIVDIGTRTVNIYTLDALEPISELSDTKNHGIHVAYDYVANFIEQEFGFSVASGNIANYIQKKRVRGLDLTPVIERGYKLLANEIFKIVDTMFVDSWVQVDNLIITGGGAEDEVLKPYLDKFPIQPVFLHRSATARGLWRYGVRHAVKQNGEVKIALPNGGTRTVGDVQV